MNEFQLETLFTHPGRFLRFFQVALTRPREFFAAASFDGKPGIAFAVIAATSAIFCLPSPFFSITFILYTVLAMILLSVLLCGVLHFFREFIGTAGGFSAYLRFTAYVGVLHLPLVLIQAVHWKLGVLFGLFLIGWCSWGFHLAFHPKVGRSLVLVLILAMPFAAASTWMMYRFQAESEDPLPLGMDANNACKSMHQLLDLTFAALPAEQRQRELTKMREEMQGSSTQLHQVFAMLETMSGGQFKIGADLGKTIQKCFDEYLKSK